jgi:hypothetical protein
MNCPTEPAAETSVTFSLHELMRIEQQRVAEHEEQLRRQEEIRQQTEREAETRQRREQSARLQVEQQLRAAQQQQAREEAARLGALQRAIEDRGRQEALQRCRAVEVQQQLQHQMQLEQLRQDRLKRKLKASVALVTIGWCATALGATVGYFGAIKPTVDQRYAQISDRLRGREQESETFKRLLEAQSTRIDKLLGDLSDSETARARLTAQLKQALQQLDRSRPGGAASAGGHPTAPPASSIQCSRDDDPMCAHGRVITDR